jgi:hypothetical protein
MTRKVKERQHGTRSRFSTGCNCIPCAEASAAYYRLRRANKASGIEATVDATPARAHVLWLESQGMPLRSIENAAGLSKNAGKLVAYGGANTPPPKKIRTGTAEALLSVKFVLPTVGLVSSLGAQRRIRAMTWLGRSHQEIARNTNLERRFIVDIVNGPYRERITPEAHNAICRYYDQVSVEAPIAGAPRTYALKLGHAPPWAWGDRIDDPDAEPDWKAEPPPGLVINPFVSLVVQNSKQSPREETVSKPTRKAVRKPIRKPISKTTRKLTRKVAAKPGISSDLKVAAIGARRRIQALAWLGRGQQQVAHGIGYRSEGTIKQIISGRRLFIRLSMYNKICRYYDEACLAPMFPGRAHVRAVALGYAPPWAWGDRIDDPAAEPDWEAKPPPGFTRLPTLQEAKKVAERVVEKTAKEAADETLRQVACLYKARATLQHAMKVLRMSERDVALRAAALGVIFPIERAVAG